MIDLGCPIALMPEAQGGCAWGLLHAAAGSHDFQDSFEILEVQRKSLVLFDFSKQYIKAYDRNLFKRRP